VYQAYSRPDNDTIIWIKGTRTVSVGRRTTTANFVGWPNNFTLDVLVCNAHLAKLTVGGLG